MKKIVKKIANLFKKKQVVVTAQRPESQEDRANKGPLYKYRTNKNS